MWLVRLKGAVSQSPAGTLSCPPPFCLSFEISSTARSNAPVFSVFPSPTAPKSVKLNTAARVTESDWGATTRQRKKTVPSTEVLCHQKTSTRPTIQSSKTSVLRVVKSPASHRGCCWRRDVHEEENTSTIICYQKNQV